MCDDKKRILLDSERDIHHIISTRERDQRNVNERDMLVCAVKIQDKWCTCKYYYVIDLSKMNDVV